MEAQSLTGVVSQGYIEAIRTLQNRPANQDAPQDLGQAALRLELHDICVACQS